MKLLHYIKFLKLWKFIVRSKMKVSWFIILLRNLPYKSRSLTVGVSFLLSIPSSLTTSSRCRARLFSIRDQNQKYKDKIFVRECVHCTCLCQATKLLNSQCNLRDHPFKAKLLLLKLIHLFAREVLLVKTLVMKETKTT